MLADIASHVASGVELCVIGIGLVAALVLGLVVWGIVHFFSGRKE